MTASTSTAPGPTLLAQTSTAAAATQATWRFLNNRRVTLPALIEPFRQAGKDACSQSPCEFVLLVPDWSKINYKKHKSKKDLTQLTHEKDIGYDLTTALLIDAHQGSPLVPMQMHLKTDQTVHSTCEESLDLDEHHLERLQPTVDQAATWSLPRRLVHVIDREADSLGHFRAWKKAEHLFLVRCDDRRVLWNYQSWLISEIVEDLQKQGCFQPSGEVLYHGNNARQQVAQATTVLHKPQKSGSTIYDANPVALASILNEWTLPTPYVLRVEHLQAGTGLVLHGVHLEPEATVFPDPDDNEVYGDAGQDCFFAKLGEVNDKQEDEISVLLE